VKKLRAILKWFLFSTVLVIIGILIFAYVAFRSFSFDDSSFALDATVNDYFQDTYEECRSAFLAVAAQVEGAESTSFSIEDKGRSGLTVNVVHMPAQKKREGLIILSSGVHGVEGFAGSAIEQMFLKEIFPKVDRDRTGFLIIHSVNPWGMKFSRRVTENNIDLNRNSDASPALFSLKNEGYKKLDSFINPKQKLNTGSLGNRFFFITAMKPLAGTSSRALLQAIAQGQYEVPKGLFYGGSDFESQVEILSSYLKKVGGTYERGLHLDIHTGYGKRGVLYLFPNPIRNEKKRETLEKVFQGYRIDWGDTDDFYTTTGDFSELIGKLLPEKIFLPMTLEFGTVNTQTPMGSIKSIYIMIMENQGFHYGYESDKDKKTISRLMREVFYPSSKRWQSEIIRISRSLFPQVIENFQRLRVSCFYDHFSLNAGISLAAGSDKACHFG
jgi:hypothetical protein